MSAVDDFPTYQIPLHDPYPNAVAITPSDTVDVTDVTRAIYVGVTGDVTATMQGGGDVLFKAVPAGTVLRIRVTRVKATGTTATQLVALW